MAEIFQQYITNNGVIVPDTSEVKEQVENEFQEALGKDLSLEESTPQGRLIESETISRKAVLENNAYMANQLNPQTASGIFLDAACALVGISRNLATHTETLATVTGVAGTIIPAGSQAKTSAGDIFQIANAYTIPAGGSGSVYFVAVESGPVACAVGTLTQIITGVLGWETINNPSVAVIGTEVESDASLRQRRNLQLYHGNALLASIASALEKVPGVLSIYLDENYTSGTKTVDGVDLLPHSLYAVVDGGSNEDVAKAIWEHKSLGCNYTGDVSVTVYGQYGNSYTVKFSRPTYKPIQVSVSVSSSGNMGQEEITQKVKDALSAWANGEIPGVDGLGLGVDVSPFEAASAITAQIPQLFVSNLEVALTSGTLGTDTITILKHEKATLAAENITVTVI